MTNQIVAEWITEWKNLDIGRADEFADSCSANEDIFQAVTHVLEESDRFRSLYDEVVSTLFSLYRSTEKKLRLFASQFVPSLVYKYLFEVHAQKKCVTLETLIRGIYELESSSEEKPPTTFRVANINLPSTYHDPGGVSSSWLSDGDLERLNTKTVKNITRPALSLTEDRIRAPHRLPLCTEVWWYFNHKLADLPKYTVPTYLKTISKLVTQGFTLGGPQRSQPQVRLILSSKLLIEAVATVYYCAYNGAPTLAEQTLEEILNRANYQLWADAICVSSAVKNYLVSSDRIRTVMNPVHVEDVLVLGQKSLCSGETAAENLEQVHNLMRDAARKNDVKKILESVTSRFPNTSNPYSCELSHHVEFTTFKKSIITNASFRTKKLPDDIPIVEKDTIPEDGILGDGPSTTPVTKSKSKLPHLLSKIKRNSVVVINEEGDVETMTMATPPERKKSVDSHITAV